MSPANDYQHMNTLIVIANTLIRGWHNHDQRNERLRSIQDLIWEWREKIRREGTERSYHDQALRACYDLATPWSIGQVQETHSNVKTRLRLIVEICEQELERLADVARKQAIAKRNYGWQMVAEDDEVEETVVSYIWSDALSDDYRLDVETRYSEDDSDDNDSEDVF